MNQQIRSYIKMVQNKQNAKKNKASIQTRIQDSEHKNNDNIVYSVLQE